MKRLLFFLVTMLTGVASLFAEEKVVTITKDDGLWTTSGVAQTGTKDGVTIATTQGALNKDGTYRPYAGQTFTVSVAEGTITGIEITCTGSGTNNYGPGLFSATVGKYSYSDKIGTWVGSSSKVELTPSKQVRMTSIKVTYEVDSSTPTPEVTALALSETTTVQTEYYVGDAFSTEGLVATATFDDASTQDVTDAASWTCEPAVIAEDTKTVTVTASYKSQTASKTYNVTVKSIANTAETAYTVEEAVALIDAGKGLNAEVYVKGIVSKVAKFNDSYGQIDYYISTDGTEEAQQLECYNGLNIGGNKFTSIDDVEVGAQVVVKGQLTQFGSTYELGRGNELVSYVMETKTVTSLTISGTPAKTAYSVGEQFSTEGLTVIAAFDDESTKDVTYGVAWTCEPAVIAKDTKTVTVTATYKEATVSETYDVTVDVIEGEQSVNFVPADKEAYNVWTGSSQAKQTGTKGGITIDCTSGYLTTEYRIYANSTLTVSVDNGTIVEVLFSNVTDKNKKSAPSLITLVSNSVGGTLTTVNLNDRKWTGSSSKVQFTCSEQARFASMTVKYIPYNTIVPYEVKAEWGTIILPFEWTAPEGWTCYSCDAVDANGVLKLTGVDKVEKNVPYIVKADAEAIGKTHNFGGNVTEEAVENEHVGVLVGVLLKGDKVPAGSYVLSKYEGKMGFFRVAENADYSASQYKCYLTLPEEDAARYGALFFDFDGETGIDNISGSETSQSVGAIYNMAGQRMNKMQKGLNIVNGKIILK